MVLAGGSELIDDIRRAPDDVLSVRQARNIVRSAHKTESSYSWGSYTEDPSNKIHAMPIEPE